MASYLTSHNSGAFAKFSAALGIPGSATSAVLDMTAGQLVTLTVTRLLTPEEIEAATEAFITEGLEVHPTGTLTYNLVKRDDATA